MYREVWLGSMTFTTMCSPGCGRKAGRVVATGSVDADSVEADSVEAGAVEAISVEADSVDAASVAADSMDATSVVAERVAADRVVACLGCFLDLTTGGNGSVVASKG